MSANRPANNPGGMECQKCQCIFIGEEWHAYCGDCQQEVDADNSIVEAAQIILGDQE